MVKVSVAVKGKAPLELDFPAKTAGEVTVGDLKAAVNSKISWFVPNRQRFTLPQAGEKEKPLPLTDDQKTLAAYGVAGDTQIRLKDLGRQVAYRQLFLWEYLGPIFLNPLMFALSQKVWGPYEPSALQVTVRNLVVGHFLKREFESVFVHKFSRPTVPLAFVFRNCAYYWGITGCLIGATLYRPAYGAVALKDSLINSPAWLYGWTAFVVINELLNLNSHLHMSSIRTPPGTPRKYPTGFGYQWIVCANYFFETMGVVGLVIITGGDVGTIVYFSIATYMMGLWAGQKYRRYQKEFDPKVFPGKRWIAYPPFY